MAHSTDRSFDARADTAERFIAEALPHLDQIRRGAYRLTANRYDAEDLVQDTLIKAYKGFHTYETNSNMRAWLFRIMHNAWVASYRARQCRPDEVLCEMITEPQTSPRDACKSAETEALESTYDPQIVEAFNALPAPNREAVYYADVQGYHYREIAALMGIPIGTVMSRLARGRRRLRTLLTKA